MKDTRKRPLSTISEIILENFMSYEYARIPLSNGLNIICGPNGSGKSSILLAISVALGQVYTERSRKLSDLIRRGKDTARVSLLFKNKLVNGRRPISFSKSDMFMLSRYLKSDGSYWYEADYREISKNEVVNLFKGFGLNPDNMLIIMHQGMVEEFAITTRQQKLKMVEEAVGFVKYRENILDAQGKLSGLVSEEDVLRQTLENAGQTLDYWKGIYDRYLVKRKNLERKEYLSKELIWAQVNKHELAIQSIEDRLKNRKRVLNDTLQQIKKTGTLAEEMKSKLSSSRVELRKLYFSLMRLEKEKSVSQIKKEIYSTEKDVFQRTLGRVRDCLEEYSRKFSTDVNQDVERIEHDFEVLLSKLDEPARIGVNQAKEIDDVQAELGKVDDKIERSIEKYVTHRVKGAVLEYRRKNIEREINELGTSIRDHQNELSSLSEEVEQVGPRIETEKTPTEVSEEIKIVSAHLMSLSDVPEEAEELYNNYSSTYEELKLKLQIVDENKVQVLQEIDNRKNVWRKALESLVEGINPIYMEILSKINAIGTVKLSELDEIESAGLELMVGFRGAQEVLLDAYTQSGGERSVSIIAFLLSLQERLVSPFRAVDEFDVHMDPRNREAMFQMIFAHVQESVGSQHVVITPSQITVTDPRVHIITVQNTYGRSETRGIEK